MAEPDPAQDAGVFPAAGDRDEDVQRRRFDEVYDVGEWDELYLELKRAAMRAMRSQPIGHTLSATALVHEAYLRVSGGASRFENRAHVLGVAGRAMRHILVDHARRKSRRRHGGDWARVTLSTNVEPQQADQYGLLELDDALRALEQHDVRMARVFELRVFGGLTSREAAEELGISKRTADSDFQAARAWLGERLGDEER